MEVAPAPAVLICEQNQVCGHSHPHLRSAAAAKCTCSVTIRSGVWVKYVLERFLTQLHRPTNKSTTSAWPTADMARAGALSDRLGFYRHFHR
jgi:hypothetical protein